MNNIHCIYPDRDATLAGYLYDDIDQADRVAFDQHLTACRLCADELDELRGVRDTLGQWAPPEPARGSLQSPVFSHQSASRESRTAWWHNVPVWAQMAAAMLVLGAAASIANLDIRYDSAGLSVRTGWSKSAPPTQQAAQTAAPVAVATASQGVAPWREELTALENQLRSEMRAQTAPVSAASVTSAGGAMSEAELRQRVRVLLDEQEKKQEQDLALHLVQLQRDSNAQRQADIRRTNQLFRDVMSTYGDEIVKQQKQINYLLPVSEK